MIRDVVLFSGGAASWAAAKRLSERDGTDGLALLFTDTSIESDDVYDFVREAAHNVGGELVWLRDGRTPWQVFHDVRFLWPRWGDRWRQFAAWLAARAEEEGRG